MTQQTVRKAKLKPLGNRVLVRRLEQEDEVKGGVILPDTARKKQEVAEVVAVGTGITTKEGKMLPFPVQVGDKILMDKYAGQEVTLENEELKEEEFVVLRADDISAIIN